ncbi:MAG: hypothetical protein K9G72_20645 [Rhodobacteraceae bacterium]|nr:hypothetical protein [Paracoccaceae bacterium]MCF8521034.1 hypothetical protein [Paracoccaceae bacterium]
MQKYLDQAITWLRYMGAVWRTRGQNTDLIAQYQAKSGDQLFTIVGSGGTVNDLREVDFQRIEAGVSASINMAGMHPIAFDIHSIELLHNAHQSSCLVAKIKAQKKPSIVWFQNRAKYNNIFVRALTSEVPTHAYARASVSVRKRLPSYRHVFRHVMRSRVFDQPNLNVNFALTGSVARLVLLACALGYRKIAFVGIDLGTTPYFWQEGVALRGQAPWQDLHGAFDPNPTAANFQGTGGLVVPTLFDFLRSLHEDAGVPLEFFTIDPRGRSRLTTFLRDELYGPGK